MTELLGLLRALGDAAGWTVAVVILVVIAYGLVKGHLVPGYIYRREVERGDRAEDAIDRTDRIAEGATTAAKAATDAATLALDRLARFSDAAVEGARRRADGRD